MSGFIGIFIYVIISGDQFEDQTKFFYIGIGLPIWLIIRSVYWNKRNGAISNSYNNVFDAGKQEKEISVHNKFENHSNDTGSNTAKQFSSEQEVMKYIEDIKDFEMKKKAIYSYAKNVLTFNEYTVINQIQSLHHTSERLFWELIVRSNESGKSFYAGEPYRIEALIQNRLISLDDQYKGKHLRVNILQESKRVYDFLKAYKPI